MPQIYIVYLSFRNCDQAIFKPGFSLGSYKLAMNKLLVRSIKNTMLLGGLSLAIIILVAILIAYLVVRRNNRLNNAIDTISMNCPTGDDIRIEERNPDEIKEMWYKEPMALKEVKCYNPAFDVTDHTLLTAIVTDRGIVYPPFRENLKKLFG